MSTSGHLKKKQIECLNVNKACQPGLQACMSKTAQGYKSLLVHTESL